MSGDTAFVEDVTLGGRQADIPSADDLTSVVTDIVRSSALQGKINPFPFPN